LPSIVLEILLGIVIGPHVLGWVSIDTPIQVLSLLGLAFLLLLAGFEVDYEGFRGRLLGIMALGVVGSSPIIRLKTWKTHLLFSCRTT
jgi:Kef-type K+ transport system membrane component KefB